MVMFEPGFPISRKPVEEKPAEKEGLFTVFSDALRSHKHANEVSRRMIEAGKEAEEQRLREQRSKSSITAG